MIRATAHGRKHSFKASRLLSNPLPGQNGLLTSRLIREIQGYIFCFLKAKFKVSLNANRGNRRYGPHFPVSHGHQENKDKKRLGLYK